MYLMLIGLYAFSVADAYWLFLGQAKTVNQFTFSQLLPSNLKDFYRYNGSLTTPPCYQNVTWTIFNQPISVSEAQVFIILHFSRRAVALTKYSPASNGVLLELTVPS